MKIDKNNWCINLKETPEGELKELFKKWWWERQQYGANEEDNFNYWGFDSSIKFSFNRWSSVETKHDPPVITIDQWYNEIYLNGQTAQSLDYNSIPVVETTKEDLLVTKADLQQLEERLTKLIEQKFGNTEQLKQETVSISEQIKKANSIYDDAKQRLNDLKYAFEKGIMIGAEIKPEEKKPIWETHPDWESCRTERERFWHTLSGFSESDKRVAVASISEAHAKRQVAEIKLMEITEKWNEGIEIKDGSVYTVYYDVRIKKLTEWNCNIDYINKNVIYFNNIESRNKSIELHKELWMDYFCINNQNK